MNKEIILFYINLPQADLCNKVFREYSGCRILNEFKLEGQENVEELDIQETVKVDFFDIVLKFDPRGSVSDTSP